LENLLDGPHPIDQHQHGSVPWPKAALASAQFIVTLRCFDRCEALIQINLAFSQAAENDN
jgi:hypothetical protein